MDAGVGAGVGAGACVPSYLLNLRPQREGKNGVTSRTRSVHIGASGSPRLAAKLQQVHDLAVRLDGVASEVLHENSSLGVLPDPQVVADLAAGVLEKVPHGLVVNLVEADDNSRPHQPPVLSHRLLDLPPLILLVLLAVWLRFIL